MKTTNMRVTGSLLMAITTVQQAIMVICNRDYLLRIKGLELNMRKDDKTAHIEAEAIIETTNVTPTKRQVSVVVSFSATKLTQWVPIDGPIHVHLKGAEAETKVRLEHEFQRQHPVFRPVEWQSYPESNWTRLDKALYL